ncbi:MAG TPA: AMP-binding protein [Burkholderiales bacterium]
MNSAHRLLDAAALARHGTRTALLCGDERIDYAALAARVMRAAGALRALGAAPGDRVLLLMRDTPEFVAAWLGAVHAGMIAVALNTKISPADFLHIRTDSEARLAIVEADFARAQPDLTAQLAGEGVLAIAGAEPLPGVPAWRDALARAPAHAEAFDAAPGEPALWIYSSGTTGRPKGIIHTHRTIETCGQLERDLLGLQAGDTVFATSKLFFSYALENGLLGPLSVGATALLHPDWAEAETVAALIDRHAPTAVFSVPSFYRRLLALPPAQRAGLDKVRHYVSAGERLPVSVAAPWREATGREIVSAYGMSETFCVALAAAGVSASGVRTGRPLAGVEVRLLNEAGAEPAPGEPGVLWVRHPALALGYVNRPEATREQFVDGWFCTRDVFVRDAEDCYAHQGRADEFLKVAGQWVQPGDVEEAVSGLDAVLEAACVSVMDADGFERLALFVIARDDARAATDAAGEACAAKLPRHKRPKWIRVVAELPRTATGKMQRYKLREQLQRELGGAV